jgi:hypothetical protein
MPTEPAAQPTLSSQYGCILNVGMQVTSEPCELIMPVATDSTTIDKNMLCEIAIIDFNTTIMPLLKACVSADVTFTHLSTEGMLNGYVPSRSVFVTPPVGTLGTVSLPSNTGALMLFYQDPDDPRPPSGRLRVGKNTIPGIAVTSVANNNPTSPCLTALQALATALQAGWANSFDSAKKWYRVAAAASDRTSPADLPRARITAVRSYLGTQRRRFTPRP